MKKLCDYRKAALVCIASLLTIQLSYAQCVVTNTNDAGGGSLRDVINACPDGGTVTFTLPAGDNVILLGSSMGNDDGLSIGKSLTISAPDPALGTRVIIDGSNLGLNTFAPLPYPPVAALSIGWFQDTWSTGCGGGCTSDNFTIENISIINTPGTAIELGDGAGAGADDVTISNVFLGVTPTGTVGTNGYHGISVNGQDRTIIENSVISGNNQNGIELINGTDGVIIRDNIIGPNVDGLSCIVTGEPNEDGTGGGNGYDGIQVQNSDNTTISGNTISCNGHGDIASSFNGKRGIYIENSDFNIITGNNIGTDITGTVALPNYKSGLLISQGSDNNTIGGTIAADRNIISGNGLNTAAYAAIPDKHGIVIDDGTGTPSTLNNISGNYIGIASNGQPLGNSKNGVEIIGDGNLNNIGGATPAHGNVISANGASGVSIAMGSSNNNIQNNFIGTDVNGCNTVAGTGNVEQGIILSSGDASFPAGIAPLVGNSITDNIIGNSINGIQTYGDEVIDGIIIQANSIGVDLCNGDIGNSSSGILIQTTLTDILIGGQMPLESNVIGNNDQNGITIDAPSSTGVNNVISGNYIGVLDDGTTAVPNDGTGITIGGYAQNITIGGTNPNEENIIAGNGGTGVFITPFSGFGITLEANNIGVDGAGNPLGNGVLSGTGYGVQVDSGTVVIGGSAFASNNIAHNESGGILINTFATQVTASYNQIGGGAPFNNGNGVTIQGGTANIIDNNSIEHHTGNGVDISGGTTDVTNNTIQDNMLSGVYVTGDGNNIGTASNGNTIFMNIQNGIAFTGGASNNSALGNTITQNMLNGISLNGANTNTIGGCAAGEFNVIGDHSTGSGIFMTGATTTGNIVDGNYIGIDATNGFLGNNVGVTLEAGANLNQIGVTCGNTISHNATDGVAINDADNNVLAANRIGTNITGTAAAANMNHGVNLYNGSTGNQVGNGTTVNIISGNNQNGVNFNMADGNFVYGNLVGVNATGTAAIANGQHGIELLSSDNNTIGGGVVGQQNVISGNGFHGINLSDAHLNIISGNTIGTDMLTSSAIPNTDYGIFVDNSNQNVIGSVGVPNVISGNTSSGIGIGTGDANDIVGNYIGTNGAGTGAVANSEHGIELSSATNTQITSNLISGNTMEGMIITSSSNNTIQTNMIGTQIDGSSALGNGMNGIHVSSGGSQNSIGGTAGGQGNIIAHNGQNGVTLPNGGALDNPIRQNSMFCNTLRGIEENGVGNENYANPVAAIGIDAATSPSVFCNPPGTYPAGAHIELFDKGPCNTCGSNNAQGMTYLGSGVVAGDGSVSFTVGGLTVVPADSNNYIITLTEPAGGLVSTSEFSDCSYWKGCSDPDVTIVAQGPIPFCQGGSVDLHATFNSGSDFTWFLDGVLQSGPTVDDSIFTATLAGDYTVLVETPDGCDSLSLPLTVTVDTPPTASAAGPDQTICEDALPATLAANTPAVGTGAWSVTAGVATADTPGSPTSTVSGIPAGTSATLTWTISNGVCPDEIDDVIINVDELPTAAAAGPDQTICEDALPALMAANAPTVGTGLWTVTSGTATPDTPGSEISTVSGITAGTSATLTWTISNGVCPDATDDVIINVDALPTVADAGPDQNVCASSANLAGNAPTVGTGTWTVLAGTGTFSPDANTENSTVSALSVGLNQFQWEITNGVCPASSDVVDINQAGTLTTPAAGPDQTICISDPNVTMAANAVAGGETGTWTVEVGSGTFADPNDPNTTVTGFGSGLNTYRWTITDGLCTPAFDEVDINVDDLPTASVAGIDQTICEDALPATLSGNAPLVGTGLWSVSAGTATPDTPGSEVSTVSGIPAGTSATLTWTISNGVCPDANDDVIINVDELPSASLAGPDQTFCELSLPGTLAANTPAVGSGAWSVSAGTATADTPGSPTSTVSGIPGGTSATLTWTISNGVCPDETDDVTINIDEAPDAAVAGTDQTVCEDALPTNVSANVPAVGTGVWSVSAGTATIGDINSAATTVDAITPGTTATLTWTISNGICPDETDDVAIIVEQAPTVSDAGSNQNPCTATSTLAANTPTVGTGMWTVTTGTASVTTPTSPTSGITGLVEGESNDFEWCISTGGVCPQSCSAVNITRQSNPVTSIAIDPVATICEGSNLTFTTTYSNEGPAPTFEWFVQNVSVQGPDNNDSYSNTTLNPGDSVYVVITGNDPCVTDNIDTNVIYPSIDAQVSADAGIDISECGNSTTLAATAPVAGSGMWTTNGASSASATITPATSETASVTNISPVGSPLILDWTVTNGMCSDVDQVVISTSPVPNPSVTLSGDQEVCENDSPGTFTATASDFGSGVTYQWFENGVAVGANSTTHSVGNLTANSTVSVAITSTDACGTGLGDSTGLNVVVVLLPNEVIGGDANICPSLGGTISTTPGTADSFQWVLNGASNLGTGTSQAITVGGTYTLIATNNGTSGTSCPVTSAPWVVTSENIVADIFGVSDYSTTVILTDEGTTDHVMVVDGNTNGTPTWTGASSGNLDATNVTDPTGTFPIGTHTLTLTGSSSGCTASATFTLIVRGPVWVPTAFSPGNGDGSNDTWSPQGLDGWDEWTVSVYNRWGSLVHTQEYEGSPFVPWDGIRNGQPMPVGTYYFVVDVPGAGTFTGPLTLMR